MMALDVLVVLAMYGLVRLGMDLVKAYQNAPLEEPWTNSR